jgi:hypothetical protein
LRTKAKWKKKEEMFAVLKLWLDRWTLGLDSSAKVLNAVFQIRVQHKQPPPFVWRGEGNG